MDFALSEQQVLLQSTINEFLQAHAPLAKVRELVADDKSSDAALTEGLAEIGVPGVLIPEEFGGVGLTHLDAALIAESLGATVAPYSFIGSAVIAVSAILQSSDEDLKQTWLPKIAEGSTQVAIAISDHTGQRDSTGVSYENGSLQGETMFALDVENANAVLVADKDQSTYLADLNEVEVIVLKSIDKTRSLAELRFHQSPAILVTRDREQLAQIIALGRVMLAADTLGAAQTMLDKAIEYAGERKQFNRVIGSFQAVKHLCAEMAADLEPCRSLVWYAAHSFHSIPDEARLVANHAKAHLAEVGQSVARKATEVHGGMGFTDLLGLHYWFKRIGLNRQLLGSPNSIRKEIAKQQGWT